MLRLIERRKIERSCRRIVLKEVKIKNNFVWLWLTYATCDMIDLYYLLEYFMLL